MQQAITMQDLEAVVRAGQVLQERADLVHSYTRSAGIHLTLDAMVQILALTGAKPEFQRRDGFSTAYPWEASIEIGGVRCYALFATDELRLIGYHVPEWAALPVRPVPITEPAPAS